MLNRILDNRYTVLEHIGGGGTADVYRAHDKLLDRFVAIKMLHPQFVNDSDFKTRFKYEAQTPLQYNFYPHHYQHHRY